MSLETPSKKGGVLENLLAQFGARQTLTSATEARAQARRETSSHSPQTATVAEEAASPAPNNHLDLQLPSVIPELSTIFHATFVSSPSTSTWTEYTSESDCESESPNDSSTPISKPSLRRARRSYVQLEGLKMENRRKDRDEAPRRSTRVRKSDILASDTVYYPATPPSKRKSGAPSPRKLDTARARLRDDIARKTQAKANGFIVAHRELFLPLLPPQNYVTKLIANDQPPSVVQYKRLPAQPKGVKATMKPYQLDGLSFLVYLHNNGFSGILSDEMGLGKTLQTLSLFQYLEEQDREFGVVSEESRPYLVICPLGVLNSWVNEARKWVPELKVLRYHGTPGERDRLKRVAQGLEDQQGNETAQARDRKASKKAGLKVSKLPTESASDSYKIIVTTYDTFKAEQSWFKHSFLWRYVVLDEGHMIKSNVTQISTALKRISSEHRLILTGTPVQNDLMELWSLLAWLLPDVFTDNSQTLFKESFDLARGRANQKTMDDARRLLELLMLRRMKDSPGVDLGLPPKEEVLLYVPLTPMQRFWYTRLLTRVDDSMLDDLFAGGKTKELAALETEKKEDELRRTQQNAAASNGKEQWGETAAIMRQAVQTEQKGGTANSAWRKLMNLVMQLRKCCSHPYLIPGAMPEPYYAGQHVIRSSGKFIMLEKLLRHSIFDQRKKVLIFSGFTETLNWCENMLEMISNFGQDFKHLRLDGGVGRARRNLEMRLFNDKKSDYKAMLLSTRAGGLGITLTAAEDVFFLDEDWNPQVTLQAEARAHRIGQQKNVTIYKLCTQGTVEEQMIGRIRKKLYLSTKITESMRTMFGEHVSDTGGTSLVGGDAPEMSTSQLKSLVRRGAQTLSHPEIDVTEMLSWDLETMLQKCRDKPADPQTSADSMEVDEQEWLSVIERVETAVFDGKRYQRKLEKAGLKGATDVSNIREDRRQRKKMTVMVDGYEVSKESLDCAQWEAVPTMAGKDPRLADLLREKRHEYVHEDYCLACFQDSGIGHMVECKSCPRVFHFDCLDEEYQEKVKGFSGFFCPQHYCCDCGKNTTDAGGLVYRCRWCPRGFCEDCLEWDEENLELIGENLPEFEMMHQPSAQTGFYIKCPDCVNSMQEDEAKREWITEMEKSYAEQHEEWFKEEEEEQQRIEQQQDAAQESRRMDSDLSKASTYLQVPLTEDERGSTPSLTDYSTTNDESGLNTPRAQTFQASSKKRITKVDSYSAGSPHKRARPTQRARSNGYDLSDDAI
ncbi:uncharacterized protein CC84DRAFT_1137534 [Paraphaeosphaeria sporulosa]|uniref:ISWI chromatin-remodeling complex ATPase ISW2 n=1 Tax=Paraphaeosphaeria sporulosa TaxID=1460663 RepID=A0A177CQ88_9PLEO|nr:uncharacterized protein CC84DRAFT_1137534 [Paraphaeosphaeria sporulosa]OAG09684.1 hypothetical protein CC84DRAFT_1137534 [Paraphaeosphaeria sporulosa]